jgi:hypothetical protein
MFALLVLGVVVREGVRLEHTLAQSGAKKMSFVMCRNKKVVRTVRTEKIGNEYHAIYSKAGTDKSLGSGQWIETSEKIVANVRKNLESSGWTCSEVSDARTVSSVP